MTSDEHDYAGSRPMSHRRFVAVCSCGWQSEPVSTAGMAGGAFDRHKAEAEERDA